MPSHYAHYHFGLEVLKELPKDITGLIKHSETSYDAYIVGLQGPDLLAFYAPFFPNAVNREGRSIHHASGTAFFEKASRTAKRRGSDEDFAYLYGCLCHYMLDSVCHPLVSKYMKLQDVTHAKVEREFDNHLLSCDGKKRFGLETKLLFPPKAELGRLIAPYYTSTTERKINSAIVQMNRYLSMMASSSSAMRSSIYNVLSIIRIEGVRNKRDMVITKKNDHSCDESSKAMSEKLAYAVHDTVEEIIGMRDACADSKPLSSRLELNYLGRKL